MVAQGRRGMRGAVMAAAVVAASPEGSEVAVASETPSHLPRALAQVTAELLKGKGTKPSDQGSATDGAELICAEDMWFAYLRGQCRSPAPFHSAVLAAPPQHDDNCALNHLNPRLYCVSQ